MEALVELVARLRGPGGCPWDARQTDSSIKIYLLEEAYEVMEAIEEGDPKEVCQELGDLLFHVFFLARLAEERGEFGFVQVVEGITRKMIRRHPHVFGQEKVRNAEDVVVNWARIKQAEKGAPKRAAPMLEGVPVALPALLRAHRVTERASKLGLDRSKEESGGKRISKGVETLQKAVDGGDKKNVAEGLGSLLFDLAVMARHWDLNAEDLLRRANRRFIKSFERLEEELEASGTDLEHASPQVLECAWEKIVAGDG